RGPGFRTFDTTTALATYDQAIVRPYIRSDGTLPANDFLQELAGSKPFTWETTADVGGGDENTKYYVAGGWSDNPGIVTNTFAKKQNIRVNFEQSFAKRLALQVTSAFTRN